jgi:ribosomal protein S18 acetylase RimI-like enzyme
MQVDKIDISEVHTLQELSRQTFSDTFAWGNTAENMQYYLDTGFDLSKLTTEINNPHTVFYFVKVDNKAIGYLKINFGPAQTELQDDKAIEIERIYVLKEFQGQKAGRLLFDKALQIARERHAAYIWLGVWEKNLKAIAFYEKNGFVQFDEHLFQFGDEQQTDIMMKLVLSSDF